MLCYSNEIALPPHFTGTLAAMSSSFRLVRYTQGCRLGFRCERPYPFCFGRAIPLRDSPCVLIAYQGHRRGVRGSVDHRPICDLHCCLSIVLFRPARELYYVVRRRCRRQTTQYRRLEPHFLAFLTCGFFLLGPQPTHRVWAVMFCDMKRTPVGLVLGASLGQFGCTQALDCPPASWRTSGAVGLCSAEVRYDAEGQRHWDSVCRIWA